MNKKSFLIVDWALVILLILVILSKFIELPFTKILQPLFMVLIVIHVIQHWKIMWFSIKYLKK